MQNGWQNDPCYASYGVDGSNCSFYEYLSKVESHCPPDSADTRVNKFVNIDVANLSFQPLFELMVDNPTNYKFIQSRILRLFNLWKNALDDLVMKSPEIKTRRKLNVRFLNFEKMIALIECCSLDRNIYGISE